MTKLGSESPEALAPEGGGNPKVTCVRHATFNLWDMPKIDLKAILEDLGIEVYEPETFQVVLNIETFKEPSGDYKCRISIDGPL